MPTPIVRTDRDYLWALEVLALDSLQADGQTADDQPDRYHAAVGIATGANLTRPLSRDPSDAGADDDRP